MKIQKNDRGFGAIEVMLIVLVIALVAGAGWYVWRSKQNTNKSKSPVATKGNVQQPKDQNEKITIPDDWQWFTSDDKSIRFAYPKTWGTLSEQAQVDSKQFIGPVVITKKKDLLTQVPKSYADFTWYTWDTNADTFMSVKDTQPPSYDGWADYTKPVSLGVAEKVEPMIISSNGFAVYHVLGKGAMNCGARHYFFGIKDTVVHLSAGLCDRGGEWQPGEGQQYTDVVEGALPELYKYIR